MPEQIQTFLDVIHSVLEFTLLALTVTQSLAIRRTAFTYSHGIHSYFLDLWHKINATPWTNFVQIRN